MRERPTLVGAVFVGFTQGLVSTSFCVASAEKNEGMHFHGDRFMF